jgi:hypothetical protein
MDTSTVVVLVVGLLVLSIASGMVGLGVAFAAAGFAGSGLVAWRPALLLTAVAWLVATARTIVSTRSGQIWRRRPAAAALDGRNLS